MKKEFTVKPEKLTEEWPGQLTQIGSWHEVITQMPQPVFVVTGWKPNGKENACLTSSSAFVGSGGEFICILGWVKKNGHMYKSLKETGCCVLNFPTRDIYDKCHNTIENNGYETDEITASNLTAEKAVKVNAPRIAECFLNIECEYLWEHGLSPENPSIVTVAVKAVHICMDSNYYDQNKVGRYGKSGYLYLANAPHNPDTGEIGESGFAALEIYNG